MQPGSPQQAMRRCDAPHHRHRAHFVDADVTKQKQAEGNNESIGQEENEEKSCYKSLFGLGSVVVKGELP